MCFVLFFWFRWYMDPSVYKIYFTNIIRNFKNRKRKSQFEKKIMKYLGNGPVNNVNRSYVMIMSIIWFLGLISTTE